MRRSTLILGLALLVASPTASADCLSDAIQLTVEPGPLAGEMALTWTGFNPSTRIFRSTDPTTLTDPGSFIGETRENSWVVVTRHD